MTGALLVHIASTWTMVGLIWFVQVVHYPLFASVGSAEFATYEDKHTRRISSLLAVPALLEVVTAAWLVLDPPVSVWRMLPLLGGLILAAVWTTTALVHVPLHQRLSMGFDTATHHRLVATNWWRTAGWSARGVLVLAMAALSV